MAVDTEPKRWSMLALSSGAVPSHVFNPETSGLSSIEKITVLQHYGGIEWSAEVVVEEVPATTGWKFLMDFDRFRKKREEDEEEREKVKEIVEAIESPVDKEIAQLLQQDIETEDRAKEIKALELLITENATPQDLIAAEAHNVAKAFVRAAIQKNFSAVEALERELDQQREQDEFLMLALVLL